jgi:peptidoglycan/LPS O-acetylase OafA/YrhL
MSGNIDLGTSIKIEKKLVHIEALRAIAVVLVIWHHYFQYAQSKISGTFLRYISDFFISFGAFGVQIFFALSGFIILTRELGKTQNETFARFMLLRYTRLWPGIVILAITSLPLLGVQVWIEALVPSFTLLDPAIFNKTSGSLNFVWMSGVMWSLFSEIRFYVIFSIIFVIFRRFSVKKRVLILVLFFGLGKALTLLTVGSDLFRSLEFITLSRDSSYFVLGMLLGLNYKISTVSLIAKFWSAFVPTVIGLILEYFTYLPAANEFFVLIPMITLMVLMPLDNLVIRFFAKYIGSASYLSYLLHINVLLLFYKYSGPQQLISEILFIPLFVFLIAFLLARYLELIAIRTLRSLFRVS